MIFEKGLSSKAIVVYCCLLRHAGEKRRCFPSRKRISVECSLGVTTVDRALTELITAGLVKKENRKNVIGGKTSKGNFRHHMDIYEDGEITDRFFESDLAPTDEGNICDWIPVDMDE